MKYIFSLMILILLLSKSTFALDKKVFTKEEQAWISKHQNLTMVINSSPYPVSIWSDNLKDPHETLSPPVATRRSSFMGRYRIAAAGRSQEGFWLSRRLRW